MSEQNELYLLKRGEDDWEVVSKADWVNAERTAGFRNTMGKPNEPATASFGSDKARGIRVNVAFFKPENYELDPELRDAIQAAIQAGLA